MDSIAPSSLAPLIALSRQQCSRKEYQDSIQTLEPLLSSDMNSLAYLEVARVHLVQGDRISALKSLEDLNIVASHQDLHSVFVAFINIGLEVDLAGAVQTAAHQWGKYKEAAITTAIAQDSLDEIAVRL